ncbi:MAG: glycosyltransferase family 4 protein [Acidimicrobiales bacterium]
MRIALAHPYSWPEVRRGAERVLHDLAWALRTREHEVEIVTGTPGSTASDVVEEVPVHRRHHHARWDVRGLSRYETFGVEAFPWVLSRRHDLVIALSPSAAIASSLAGRRTVFYAMGWPTAQWWEFRPMEARMFRAALRLSRATAVLSNAAADSVESLTGSRPSVLPAGIRLEAFPVPERARSGPPTVLFASWAEEKGKGLDLLLEAFALLLADEPDARLLLAGGGDPRWALERLDPVARAMVSASMQVVGSPSQPISPATFASAHVTVLPSQMESFGLVLLESLACGTPVVGSAVGGLLDVAGGCDVARLVPHADVGALHHALREAFEMAGDPVTATRARSHAATFDWRTVIGPLHATFYDGVANGGDSSTEPRRHEVARSN